MQDHDRALIVGRRSFGKALMQTGFLVPSGFIARRLAARAAFVRWPPDGGADLVLQNDPDVRAALASFPRLKELLAAPAGTR